MCDQPAVRAAIRTKVFFSCFRFSWPTSAGVSTCRWSSWKLLVRSFVPELSSSGPVLREELSLQVSSETRGTHRRNWTMRRMMASVTRSIAAAGIPKLLAMIANTSIFAIGRSRVARDRTRVGERPGLGPDIALRRRPFSRSANVPSRPAIGSAATNGSFNCRRRDRYAPGLSTSAAVSPGCSATARSRQPGPDRPVPRPMTSATCRTTVRPPSKVGVPAAAPSVFSSVSAYWFWLNFISRSASVDSGGERWTSNGSRASPARAPRAIRRCRPPSRAPRCRWRRARLRQRRRRNGSSDWHLAPRV